MQANKEFTPLESAIECLQDVISHHDDFRSACGTRHHADLEKYGGDSASYWTKQQGVLDRMKAQAELALPAIRTVLASQGEPVYQCRDKLAVRWKDIAESEYNLFPESFHYRTLNTAPPAAVPAPDPLPTYAEWRKVVTLVQRIVSTVRTGPAIELAMQCLDSLDAWSDQVAAPAPAQANAWEEAVKDACTVAGELGWNEADPRASLNKLIEWHIQVALDPRVSDRAPAQAVDALGIKTWQERMPCPPGSAASKVGYMAAEIADLRAALAAQPAAPDAGLATIDSNEFRQLAYTFAVNPSALIAHVDQWGARRFVAGRRAMKSELHRAEIAKARAAPVANAGQAQSFDAVWDALDWDKWRSEPIRELVRHIYTLTTPSVRQAQAVAVPDGWRLVPVEPTEEMDAAARAECHRMAGCLDPVMHIWDVMLAAAPLPQQVAQPFPTSRDAYEKMTPERKAALDADLKGLEQRIESHRRNRDRRTHTEQVEFDRRKGDRRHAERRDAED